MWQRIQLSFFSLVLGNRSQGRTRDWVKYSLLLSLSLAVSLPPISPSHYLSPPLATFTLLSLLSLLIPPPPSSYYFVIFCLSQLPVCPSSPCFCLISSIFQSSHSPPVCLLLSRLKLSHVLAVTTSKPVFLQRRRGAQTVKL